LFINRIVELGSESAVASCVLEEVSEVKDVILGVRRQNLVGKLNADTCSIEEQSIGAGGDIVGGSVNLLITCQSRRVKQRRTLVEDCGVVLGRKTKRVRRKVVCTKADRSVDATQSLKGQL
jgi:hypothetical protein